MTAAEIARALRAIDERIATLAAERERLAREFARMVVRMTDPKPSDVAAEAVVWSLVADVARERKDEARAWLSNHMGPDAAAVKAVANGETIGRATWIEGKDTLAVVDP